MRRSTVAVLMLWCWLFPVVLAPAHAHSHCHHIDVADQALLVTGDRQSIPHEEQCAICKALSHLTAVATDNLSGGCTGAIEAIFPAAAPDAVSIHLALSSPRSPPVLA